MAFTSISTFTAGQVLTSAAMNAIGDDINQLGTGYTFVSTLYFTTSGSFVKATYPWLRALRVRAVGAGGGGGYSGTVNNYAGSGGGGGGYCEKFTTDIASLLASETISVGANGTGGTSTANGTNGGSSTAFGVTAGGGGGGTDPVGAIPGSGGTASGGDLNIVGQAGFPGGYSTATVATHRFGQGGSSLLGFGSRGASAGQGTGINGSNYGGGGGGGYRINTSYNGGAGADGIVIVDLFA